jgi:hypothetical protein
LIRIPALLLLTGLLAAAAPAEDSGLPVPPLPPEHPPGDVAAPIPNLDAHGPVIAASKEAQVGVELYRAQHYDPSRGFTPGSRFQSSEDRKPIQTPGLSIRFPLQ